VGQKVIAFLRGVNMAGHNTIKMAELVTLFKETGYEDAETYIASGNVVFSAGKAYNAEAAEKKIETAIKKRFGHDMAVMLRSKEELDLILKSNPFSGEGGNEHSKIATVILKEKPSSLQIQKMAEVSYPPDKFFIHNKEIYIHCPNGFGKTKLYTNFFEGRMKVIGTARNWRTMITLSEIANRK
jgi:uncharacterized protein (DUF1697 family)